MRSGDYTIIEYSTEWSITVQQGHIKFLLEGEDVPMSYTCETAAEFQVIAHMLQAEKPVFFEVSIQDAEEYHSFKTSVEPVGDVEEIGQEEG